MNDTTVYQPMRNDYRDFNPVAPEWSYILDEAPPATWRELVAVNRRHATWPFQPHGYGGRWFHSVRLSPDWCFLSWGAEYVLADWDESSPGLVNVRLRLTRRPHEWVVWTQLDLREQVFSYTDADVSALPADVFAELAIKCDKLLAFFADACQHWHDGDQPRPINATDLYTGQ